MWRILMAIDSLRYHDIRASGASLMHAIRRKAMSGREMGYGASSEYWHWIVLQFLTAARMTRKLRRKQPLMKWWWEHCRHYVNSLYLLANNVTLIYPSQQWMMCWSDYTRRRVHFKNRKCRSLWRSKWINCLQVNPISYEDKRFI